METITEYDRQAQAFLTATSTEFSATFLKHDFHFDGDKGKRDIYLITLKRGSRSYTFNFGQSIARSGKYKGHKNLCLNTFDQFIFSEAEYNNLKARDSYSVKYCEIVPNPEFKEPTPYDVLACLTKYDPETFENFCSEYGYDQDSRNAKKVYKAVKNEWQNVAMLYNNDEIEQLAEIS